MSYSSVNKLKNASQSNYLTLSQAQFSPLSPRPSSIMSNYHTNSTSNLSMSNLNSSLNSSITSLNRDNPLLRSESKLFAYKPNPFYTEIPYMQERFRANPQRSLQASNLLRFFIARHGERIDLTFGLQWIEKSFDQNGKYKRVNLNMPNDLPVRSTKREFIGDSPLTEIGKFQAKLTGEALGIEGYKLHYCYSSPSLRCIQTAHKILKAQGLEKTVKIRIEPSLFEFLGLHKKGIPQFLTYEPLLEFGYNIDVNYKQFLPVDRLQPTENYKDYYQRSFALVKHLANVHMNDGANVLVIGHAGTLEACTRQISGSEMRPYLEFNSIVRKVPYLGLCLLEKEASSQAFEIKSAVIPPLSHASNTNFDKTSLNF